MLCKFCETEVSSKKKWGYRNICAECDDKEPVNKSVAVLIADGKTDYHFKIIQNPTKEQAAAVRLAGTAHDPRTNLRAINKVSD
jgi:hypothetical protein